MCWKQNRRKSITQKDSELFAGYLKICPSQIKYCFFPVWRKNTKNALLDRPVQCCTSTKKTQFGESLWPRLFPIIVLELCLFLSIYPLNLTKNLIIIQLQQIWKAILVGPIGRGMNLTFPLKARKNSSAVSFLALQC